MLVLSRRTGQEVVFPGLGITIDVLRSCESVVRLGIEAPEDVAVLRDEVMNPSNQSVVASEAPPVDRERHHQWKNKLNEVLLKLQLLQRQLELGKSIEPERRLRDIVTELTNLERTTTDSIVGSKSPKVLIVEDQPDERELLATCLRLGGLEVATARNGRDAFDYLHEHDLPDLVLLDMRTPEVDGPTFLKSVRDDFRLHALRVFAVSGSSRDEFDADPLPLDGWISKPVRIDALLQAVRTEYSSAAVTT